MTASEIELVLVACDRDTTGHPSRSPCAPSEQEDGDAIASQDRRPVAAGGLIGVVAILVIAVATGTLGGQAAPSPTPDLGAASPTASGPASAVPTAVPSTSSGAEVNVIFVPTFPPDGSPDEPPEPPKLAA